MFESEICKIPDAPTLVIGVLSAPANVILRVTDVEICGFSLVVSNVDVLDWRSLILHIVGTEEDSSRYLVSTSLQQVFEV